MGTFKLRWRATTLCYPPRARVKTGFHLEQLMPRAFSFVSMTLVLGCLGSKSDWVERLERNGYSSVEVGRYPHRTEIVRPPYQDDKMLKELRTAVERDPAVMNRMAATLFPEGEGDPLNLRFAFRSVGIDREEERLVLRYFAPIPDPFIFAGYQIQFVFALPSGDFQKAYVAQLPLD